MDAFLMELPDHPKVPGLSPEAIDLSGNQSNSIAAWTRLLKLEGWSQPKNLHVTSLSRPRVVPEGSSLARTTTTTRGSDLPLVCGTRAGRTPSSSSIDMEPHREEEEVGGSL